MNFYQMLFDRLQADDKLSFFDSLLLVDCSHPSSMSTILEKKENESSIVSHCSG